MTYQQVKDIAIEMLARTEGNKHSAFDLAIERIKHIGLEYGNFIQMEYYLCQALNEL